MKKEFLNDSGVLYDCIYCDCYDSDYGGCTMPSVDRAYACHLSDALDDMFWDELPFEG